MKKAIIVAGGRQYLVAEGDKLSVAMAATSDKTVKLDSLLVIDGEKISVSKGEAKAVVSAKVLGTHKDDKVTAIRYKAKKRVKKVRGHRQQLVDLEIVSIA